MYFRKKKSLSIKSKHKQVQDENPSNIPEIRDEISAVFKKRLQYSSDLVELEIAGTGIILFYIDTLIDQNVLRQHVILPIKDKVLHSIKEITKCISISDIKEENLLDKAILGVLAGNIMLYLEGESSVLLVKAPSEVGRTLSQALNETQVIGPQVAFNESFQTNLSLIRKYISDPNLCIEKLQVGSRGNTSIAITYINGIASKQMVSDLRQRIQNIKVDAILDSSMLQQLIEENSLSIFPQMQLTERPDRVCDWLLKGKLAIFFDGSSLALVCPQSFFEYFQSMEDSNVNWQIASFLRLLRIIGLFLSVFFTAIYVAALTFHYEIIPQALLIPLSESRARVPFPPIVEAFLLEFVIELLREAGARLPTKIGQTIGIVGGIVIGTAAVDAGFTSNILIIIVSLGALSSFATPSYIMGNVIRVLRFPLIILAGFWGFLGIMYGFCFLLIHLLRQSSLGSPFLAPFYPPRLADWKDSIIRLPYSFTFKRPNLANPDDEFKYNPEKAKQKN